MSRVTTAVLAALFVAIPAQAAQRKTPVQQGARVRLELWEPPSIWVGTALPSTPDSLVVQYPSGEEFRVSLLQLKNLQVSGGTRTRRLEGAVLGALVGVGFGVLIESSKEDECVSTGSLFSYPVCLDWAAPERHYGKAGGLGGFAGAVIGAVVGSAIKTERWLSIPLDFRLP